MKRTPTDGRSLRVPAVVLAIVITAMATGRAGADVPSTSGGHDAFGAAEASGQWYFAEGYTGNGFQEYLTLANPSTTPVDATITYFFNGAGPGRQIVPLPATSRTTIDVNAIVGLDREVSMSVTAPRPIIAERPMYFRAVVGAAGILDGGHDIVGATELSETWYFAEGFTGEGFQEYITIQNPQNTPVAVDLLLSFPDGGTQMHSLSVPAAARATVDINAVAPGKEISLLASAEKPVMVERPVYFARARIGAAGFVKGGHDVAGAPAPALVWHFAEGYTGPGYQEYVTIQNPNASPVHAEVVFFLADGSTRTQGMDLPPTSRATLDVNSVVPAGSESSIQLTAALPVVVERPMYFSAECSGTCMFASGHNAMGATELSTTWFFAEGYTGRSPTQEFRQYITIANPNPAPVTVPITFFLANGTTVSHTKQLAGTSRGTVDVRAVVGLNQEVSAQVGPASAPIVAERPMYWGSPYYVAQAAVDTILLYDAPHGVAYGYLPYWNAEGGVPYVFRIVEQVPGWHRVLTPTRPNHDTAWIPDHMVTLHGVRHRLHVDLSDMQMHLFDHDVHIASFPVGIGTDEHRTPVGNFYILEGWNTPPSGAFGPFGLGLSAHSETISDFLGGDGRSAIHGTNAPGIIPGKVSHGCLRLHNENITFLVHNIELGSPVEIVP